MSTTVTTPAVSPRESMNPLERFVLNGFILTVPLYISQAALNWALGGRWPLGELPPPVLMTWLCLAVLLMSPTFIAWLAQGPGRAPAVLGLLGWFGLMISDGFSVKDTEALKKSAQLLTGIVAYCLAFRSFSSPVLRHRLLSVVFLTCGSSGLVALLEGYTRFITPWSVYVGSPQRAGVGLEGHPVPFVYSLLIPIVLAATVCLARVDGLPRTTRWTAGFGGLLGFVGIAAAASRSGTAGIVLGSAIGVFLLGALRRGGRIACIVLAVVVASPLLVPRIKQLDKGDISQDARVGATWIAYMPLVASNPLGLSPDSPKVREFLGARKMLGIQLDAASALEGLAVNPHNAFMTTSVNFGWIPGIVLLLLYLYPAALLLRSYRRAASPESRLWASAALGAIAGFAIHSSFHNSSILIGEMRNWIWIGFFMEAGLAAQEHGAPRLRQILAQPPQAASQLGRRKDAAAQAKQ